MRSERLSFKVFWATLIGFMSIIFLWMVLQTIFFEPFYISQKKQELAQRFEEVYIKYASGSYQLKTKPLEVAELEHQFYGMSAFMYKQENNIDVQLGDYISTPASTVSPSMGGNNYQINIHSIVSSNNESPQSVNNTDETLPATSVLPSSNLNTERLSFAIGEWMQNKDALKKLAEAGKISVDKISGNDRNESMLFAAAKLPSTVNQTGAEGYFIMVATLQPVGDAVHVMGQFYMYFYALAFLLVLLFANFFSRTITKPLVQLNKVADRLAQLDFSAAVRLDRKDEIGQLSKTMNNLAHNLKQTMDELQEANTKLLADIEKEKQLEQMRKRFIASVSHELKTPVSLIQGYAEALQDNVGHGLKREKYTGVIMEESERMARLVNDLLDLSQLESGRFALHWSKVPLQQTIRSVLNKMAPLLHEKSIQTQLKELDPDECWVRSDSQRLEQVIMNFIGNAIRHMPLQGRLEIEVSNRLTEPASILVEITNEGSPIPVEDLPYIWDTFYRADSSGNREFGGTGIGLSIVKAILQRHESQYGVRNEDRGVTFYFTLPLAAKDIEGE